MRIFHILMLSVSILAVDIKAHSEAESFIGKERPEMKAYQGRIVKTDSSLGKFSTAVGTIRGKEYLFFSLNTSPSSDKPTWIVLDALQAPKIPEDYEFLAGACEKNLEPHIGSMSSIIGAVKFDYSTTRGLSVDTFKAWEFDFESYKLKEIDPKPVKCYTVIH